MDCPIFSVDSRNPTIASRVKLHTKPPISFASYEALVSLVFGIADLAEVLNTIIATIVIDVIDLVGRPTPMVKDPNQARSSYRTCYPKAGKTDDPIPIAAPIACYRACVPSVPNTAVALRLKH